MSLPPGAMLDPQTVGGQSPIPPTNPVAAAQLPLQMATAGANMPPGAQLPIQAAATPQAATNAPANATGGAMSVDDPLMQMYLQNIQRGQESVQRLRGLGQQQADIPTATAWHPQYQHGQGAGGFLHNLGQALMSVGLATKHGQMLQSAMARGPQEQRAQEIEGIQAQAKPEEEALKFEEGVAQGAGGLAYKQGMLGVRQQQADTQAAKEKDYARSIDEMAKYHASTIEIRDRAQTETGRKNIANEVQQKANEAGRMWRAQHHDATTIEAAGIVAGTKESIANELAARDPSIKAWLFNALGIEVPQTEAPSPTFRPTPSTEATTPPSPSAKSPSRPEASKAAPPRKAAAAKYKEGQTATGPNGHQIVFQSGQWVDKSKLPAVGPGQ
jgi:hypothetical protein